MSKIHKVRLAPVQAVVPETVTDGSSVISVFRSSERVSVEFDNGFNFFYPFSLTL